MESGVFVKYYMDLPFDRSEILRYAGVRRGDQASADGQVAGLLERCVALVAPVVSPKVCWMTLPVSLRGDVADLGAFSVRSADFARCVCGADRLVLFAATSGAGVDRLAMQRERVSAAEAQMIHAAGAQQVEALCDAFCGDIAAMADAEGLSARPRYSPGFGDTDLSVQRDIFRTLDCARRIGLNLGGSLLMSPSKSVTAFIALKKKQ